MVWVVSECAFGAEITEVVGVATSAERGRLMADTHWNEKAERVGSIGDDGRLHWLDDGRSYYQFGGRRFFDPYLVEEFPVL